MASGSSTATVIDAEVRESSTKNFGSLGGMIVRGGASPRIVHIQASMPKVAATVTSAFLELRQSGEASTGSRTLSLRRITGPWREDKITYANRPERTEDVTDSVTLSGVGSDGRLIRFDVLDDVQAFFDGAVPNFGWTIESSSTNQIGMHSSESLRTPAQLVITWSETPAPPTDLRPSGSAVVAVAKPKLRWSFIDLAGDTTLGAVQVHLAASATGWTQGAGFPTPSFDTGTITTTGPEVDLATTAFGAMTSGQTLWWTARHRDGAGLWSKYSDPQAFSYRPHQAVPLAQPGGVVNDTTFPVVWTAANQSRYQVIVKNGAGALLYDGRVITSTATRDAMIPRGIIDETTGPHEVGVRVWDQYEGREDQPGVPSYVETTIAVTYAETTDVTKVTSLEAVPDDDQPGVELIWKRATAPALFAIWVDGNEHLVDEPEAFGSAGTYRYHLDAVGPTIAHEFEVKAIETQVVSGVTRTRASAANRTVIAANSPIGVWLVDPNDPARSVRMLEEPGQDIVSTEMPEARFTFEPVGSSTTVQVTTALRGISGTVTDGVLADYGVFTAGQLRARIMAMKGDRLQPYTLVWGTQAVPVNIYDVNVTEASVPGATRYKVSFGFSAAEPSTEYELT